MLTTFEIDALREIADTIEKRDKGIVEHLLAAIEGEMCGFSHEHIHDALKELGHNETH